MIPGSNKDHPSFLRSFGYAIEGFMTAVKTERNIKVMLVAGILTVIAGLVAKLQLISWALIAICIGLVIFAELCNTCLLYTSTPDFSHRQCQASSLLVAFSAAAGSPRRHCGHASPLATPPFARDIFSPALASSHVMRHAVQNA